MVLNIYLYNQKIKEGNQQAFKILFETLYVPLYHYAFSFLSNSETAEEIVQEAFLMIWDKREKIDDNFNIKAYLYKSIHNQALNYIRHQRVIQKYARYHYENNISLNEPAQEPNPFLNQALQTAILELPERARLIFQMSRIDGLRHSEIAAELCISEKTVEVQVRKARLYLKKKLKRYYKEL